MNPDIAIMARNGELPKLIWEGGVDATYKGKTKKGTLRYLAFWLGLRGDDLYLDLDEAYTLQCTKTGVKITFQNY